MRRLAVLLALAGCAAVPQGEPPLAGTRWQLVELRPAGLFAAPLRMADPLRYTLTFEAHGGVAARLDCNRGRGAWNGTALGQDRGELRVSPMVVTRALCPMDSLGDQLARLLPAVRYYEISDDELRLSPGTSGPRLVWHRIGP